MLRDDIPEPLECTPCFMRFDTEEPRGSGGDLLSESQRRTIRFRDWTSMNGERYTVSRHRHYVELTAYARENPGTPMVDTDRIYPPMVREWAVRLARQHDRHFVRIDYVGEYRQFIAVRILNQYMTWKRNGNEHSVMLNIYGPFDSMAYLTDFIRSRGTSSRTQRNRARMTEYNAQRRQHIRDETRARMERERSQRQRAENTARRIAEINPNNGFSFRPTRERPSAAEMEARIERNRAFIETRLNSELRSRTPLSPLRREPQFELEDIVGDTTTTTTEPERIANNIPARNMHVQGPFNLTVDGTPISEVAAGPGLWSHLASDVLATAAESAVGELRREMV